MTGRQRRGITVASLLAVLALMIGLTAASVPLYRLFCQATGYGGATRNAAAAPAASVAERLVTVRFDASQAPGLGWEFRPLVASVQVHPGEETVIAYRATNRTAAPVTGTATHNVTPLKAGLYFDKLQCFCFTRQHLEPGESVDLAVSFFVDPDIATDPNTSDVDTITLSYTMFRAKDEAPALAAPLAAAD
ncbi:MAG: cytochrome c oxidase assembly protein [Stellaceae bacterium]